MIKQIKYLKNLTKNVAIKREFTLIDLRNFFNNDGISYDDLKCDGNFDGKGCTFPAEELPPSNSIVNIDLVPYYFPSKERGFSNNMVLSGQTIAFEPRKYKTLHILGAVDGQSGEVYEEEVVASLDDGSYKSLRVGLSHWLLPPKYNEKIAFLCSHLHYPDSGQQIINNTEAPKIDGYLESTDHFYSSLAYDEKSDAEESKKGVWRPRLFVQKTHFELDQNIAALTVMDNLNFHIFSLTLEF